MDQPHARAHPQALALLIALALALSAPLLSPAQEAAPAGAEDTAPVAAPTPAAGDDGVFPPPVHQTRLQATFDPETRRIDGRERLRWHNTASVPITELQFHLYLNAFSSNQTTFMRGSGGEMRGSRFDGKGWGWIEVESMKLPDGTDLKAVEEFLAPQDANPYDHTVARYPLPEPLPPGGWIELDVEFTSVLPTPPFARTGTRDGYVLAGQWFPKIAVFEDAGVRGRKIPGWNAPQFNPNSEFYADFGDFDVTLTLPERYQGKIGATGRQIEQQVADGQVTVRYRQRGVHDFAWTADPDYIVHKVRFDPQRDVPEAFRRRWAEILGKTEEAVTLTPVDIELYLQPDHARQAARYIDAAKVALRGYGTRLGAYPYDTLTLVDPPLGALGSGGMEYPTFITLGTHSILELAPFRGVLAPEVVTVHEFGHQFFQGMIANNEFEESWIDEGINTYYENQVMADAYGPASVTFLGISSLHLEGLRNGGLDGGEFRDPLATPSWRFISGRSYGLNSYDRTGLVLDQLERLLGPESFHRAMRAFFQHWRYHHPGTADFERSIARTTGEDLGWYFSQALHSTRNLDYAVSSLDNQRLRKPRGVFWRGGERYEIPAEKKGGDEDAGTAADAAAASTGGDETSFGDDSTGDETTGGEAGDAAADDADEAAGDAADDTAEADDDDSSRPWRSRVVVFRHGEFIHPVTVELTFDDGTVTRRHWDGDHRWVRWTFTGPHKLISAEVDPDHVMVLDFNRLNNSRTSEADPAPALGFLADLLYGFQVLLAAMGLLA